LRRRGWRILRFWNNEIRANRREVLQAIANALGPPTARSPHPDPAPLAGEGASVITTAAARDIENGFVTADAGGGG